MRKAFDSVSMSLFLLCWQRVGVPLKIAEWLAELDLEGNTIVWTPHALDQFKVQLCMLEHIPTTEHHFQLRNHLGVMYEARDICFADDLPTGFS